ncbi:hypothetical protein CCUS01_14582 [Colletotrichum cuscutae]|uniref:Uncharacterized protein n=1 Tax=Colletotrichum cuscutae TaxID=1209917 RepID=A0AAI9Y8T0_9PEZI|nr:hypothetical protein CCUS01_14582 [Colletotrichum cuscutae]
MIGGHTFDTQPAPPKLSTTVRYTQYSPPPPPTPDKLRGCLSLRLCIFSENRSSLGTRDPPPGRTCKATQCRQAPGPRAVQQRREKGEKKRKSPPPLNHFNQVRSGKTGVLADGRMYPAPTRVTSSNSPAGAVPAADLVPRLGRRLEAV